MKHWTKAALLASALLLPTAGHATTLVDAVNLPSQTNTPYSISFDAGAASTEIAFAGYNVPSYIDVTNISLVLTGSGTNLLASNWSFIPAPSGSLAGEPGDSLFFGGVTVGSYDTFFQNIGTTVGSNYTLSFLLSNNLSPNGFRVTASNATLNSAVPEPGTWAMMLIGFGAVGYSMRRARRVKVVAAAA